MKQGNNIVKYQIINDLALQGSVNWKHGFIKLSMKLRKPLVRFVIRIN